MNKIPNPILQTASDGAHGWLAPQGSWGWSNAGLIVDGEESLLVDTLFDLTLTDPMLQAMRSDDPQRIEFNVDSLYREFSGGTQATDFFEFFSRMAALVRFSEEPDCSENQLGA